MIPLESKVIVDDEKRGIVVRRRLKRGAEYLVLFEDSAGWYSEDRVSRDGQTQLEAA